MPSFGRIFLGVSLLGLIGLGVAAAIGAALVIVLVAGVVIVGWYIYKRTSNRIRYGRPRDARITGRN
jgi:hypothetical protein